MPAFNHLGRGINEIVDFLLTGKDSGDLPKTATTIPTCRSTATRATS